MKVHSIFQSIDGECNVRGQGSLTTFLRLSGCNLKCSYCDTPESRSGGQEFSIDEVLQKINEFECPNLTITGGEPLLQAEEVKELVFRLLVSSKWQDSISIETNGTIDPFEIISPHDSVSFVMDYKLPSSGYYVHNNDNYQNLRRIDWVKFVICTEFDYHTAVTVVKDFFGWPNKARLAFSPVMGHAHDLTWPNKIAKWMIRDGLWHVNLNVQLHKLIDMP